MKVSRKKLIFAGITAAAFIGASSVAFACLVVKGQIQLTTAGGSGEIVKSDGVSTASHGICVSPVLAASGARAGRVTVAVAPTTCGTNPSSQLADSTTAKVVLQYSNTNPGWTRTGPGTTWTFATGNGCYGPLKPITYTLTSTFTIASGSGTGNFRIPSTASISDANEAAHICVRDANGRGAFAPLIIT